MTEEQRVKLEELITEYGHKAYARSHHGIMAKARDRITDHLDTIPNLLDKKGRLSRITAGLRSKNRRGKFPPNKGERGMFDRTDDFMIVHEPIDPVRAGFNAATERVIIRANVQEDDNTTSHYTVAEFFTTTLDGIEIVNAERAAMAFVARTRILNRWSREDRKEEGDE